MLWVSGIWDLPLDDLLGDFILNYETSPCFSFNVKQSGLGFVFTLVLAGALGTVEAQREMPTGMKLVSNWGFAAFTLMQAIPPVSSTPEAHKEMFTSLSIC